MRRAVYKASFECLRKMITAHGDPVCAVRLSAAVCGELGASHHIGLPSAINPLRSLRNLIAWAESLSTYDESKPARSIGHRRAALA